MSKLPALIAFALILGAFYAGDAIMLVRFWRALRAGAQGPLVVWTVGLLAALVFIPLLVVVVPAAYVLCYRPLQRSSVP